MHLESLCRLYRSLLRSCARRFSLRDAERLHATAVTFGLASIPKSFVLNALLHVYCRCGDSVYARRVFDQIPLPDKDAFDWTALIACYNKTLPVQALTLFREMHAVVDPDVATMICVFQACARLGDPVVGNHFIGCMVKLGLPFTLRSCNSVIHMYVKCGLMDEAKRVFGQMEEKSVVTWTTLLEGLVRWEGVDSGKAFFFHAMPEKNEVAWTILIKGLFENGCKRDAFALLAEMVFGLRLRLNHVTLCSILSGFVRSGDLETGKWVHMYSLKTMEKENQEGGNYKNIMLGTNLIDMYAKCGRINLALMVFHSMGERRNVGAWNAILCGLSMHGKGMTVLELFSNMLEEAAKPDNITMTAVLSACSHSGLVNQGLKYFCNLKALYGITPQVEHYSCVVDLLGRAGRIKEAENIIKEMPIRPNSVVWGSLMGSCRVYGELKVADNLSKFLVEMDVNNTDCHVLLSNLYTQTGRLEKANFFRRDIKEKGLSKVPGISSVHTGGEIHHFTSGDRSHPRAEEIYSMLDEVVHKLRLAGYVPNTDAQVFPGCDRESSNYAEKMEEKEQALFSHSEKLAVCFGLMSTKPGTTLYIFKNLRICQDCHSAMKFLSSIYDREIVVRDRSRFHTFKQGCCSCSDYW